jgi:hypothetical protein
LLLLLLSYYYYYYYYYYYLYSRLLWSELAPLSLPGVKHFWDVVVVVVVVVVVELPVVVEQVVSVAGLLPGQHRHWYS